MSNKRKIFFAACNHWTSPYQVGSHHLAKQFINHNWETCFISDPLSLPHILSRNKDLIKERFRIYKNKGVANSDSNFWSYVPFSLFSPQNAQLLKSKFVFNNWQNFTFPNCFKMIKNRNFDSVDVIYLDSIVQGFWLSRINYNKSILRIADNNLAYGNDYKSYRIMEREIAQKVDIVVYTSKTLSGYVDDLNPRRAEYLPNGVDTNYFRNASTNEPVFYKNIPHPRAVYVGQLNHLIDTDALVYASQKLPDVSFILIGKNQLDKNIFKYSKNIYFTGFVSYDELPAYLINSDVGIIPFDVTNNPELINNVSSNKMYQYFACGLPTVSCSWENIKRIESPALLYNSKDEFVEFLKSTFNSKIERMGLIKYAEDNDWADRYKLILKFLNLNEND